MQLSEYLASKRIRLQDFADLIGLSVPTVSKLANGVNRPTFATMEAILKATGGEVTANDFAAQHRSASQPATE